jgi:hypothetical protein
MPVGLSKKCRRNLALLLIAAAGGAALGASRHAAAPVDDRVATDAAASVVSCDRDGLRYEYHVPTGGESLHDAKNDPDGLVNVIRDHEDIAAACRLELEGRFGVSALSDLRAGYADTIRRLHAVGYF